MKQNMNGRHPLVISEEEAPRLLQVSRKAEWLFPSSLGRPVAKDIPEWLNEIITNQSLLPLAVKYFVENSRLDDAYELTANVWRLWVLQHREKDGRIFLGAVLRENVFPPTRHCALALYGDGLLAYRLGDTPASRKSNNEALTIADKVDDIEAQGLAMLGLSRVEFSESNFELAYNLALGSLNLLNQLGPSYGQGVLTFAGQSAMALGLLDEAEAFFLQSLKLNRRLGDETMFTVDLHNLGHAEVRLGKLDEAAMHFNECEQISNDPDDPYGLSLNLFNKAVIAFGRNDIAKAKSLVLQSREIINKNDVRLAPEDESALKELEQRVSDQ